MTEPTTLEQDWEFIRRYPRERAMAGMGLYEGQYARLRGMDAEFSTVLSRLEAALRKDADEYNSLQEVARQLQRQLTESQEREKRLAYELSKKWMWADDAENDEKTYRARIAEPEATLKARDATIEELNEALDTSPEMVADLIDYDTLQKRDNLRTALRFLLRQVDEVERTSVIRESDVYRAARAALTDGQEP